MNNKTMVYGLLALGGVLAYYAWKKNSLSAEQSLKGTSTTPLSHTSGIFVDDVPVNPSVLGIPKPTSSTNLVKNVKDTVSSIVEPFIGKKKQTQLTGQGKFLES
jgi:hypothetical protein